MLSGELNSIIYLVFKIIKFYVSEFIKKLSSKVIYCATVCIPF